MEWANDYVGIPFKWGGYDRQGTYCYGLVWMVLREQFGIDLPQNTGAMKRYFTETETSERYSRFGIPLLGDQWSPGDVLHMFGCPIKKAKGHPPLHVGVCLGGTKVLHMSGRTASCIIDVSRPLHRWRPVMGYRPCAMN